VLELAVAGWDFVNVWDIVETSGKKSYPYLRAIPQDPVLGLE